MKQNRFAIECIHLKKSFGKKHILRDIHFKVAKGTVVGLVGPNGIGKTTLLKILATLITPSDGKALIFGEDVVANPLQIKREIGFVSSEERSFYWRLTAKQNLQFFAALHDIHGNLFAERAGRLLAAVGLEGKERVRFREYSTGMKQALGIVRGMIHDPPLVLMDEPTRSLSPDIAKKVRYLIREKACTEGKTILIASHNLKEVEALADTVAILHQGVIQATESPDALKRIAGVDKSADLDKIFDILIRD